VVGITAIQALDVFLIVVGVLGILYLAVYRPIAFIPRTGNVTDDTSERWRLVRAEGVSLVRELIRSGLWAVAILALALLTGWVLVTIVSAPPIVASAIAVLVALLTVRFVRRGMPQIIAIVDLLASGRAAQVYSRGPAQAATRLTKGDSRGQAA
jgi:hypothetical protein